jgi:carbon storage regulator
VNKAHVRGPQGRFDTHGKEFSMLVLSRRLGESIVIPNSEVTLTVLSIEGSRVRLGISGPRRVKIYRQEVWRRLVREGEQELTVAAEAACK